MFLDCSAGIYSAMLASKQVESVSSVDEETNDFRRFVSE